MSFKTGVFSNNEQGNGYTHWAYFDYNGINDNATSSNQATIASVPQFGSVELVTVIPKTSLAGASDITLDVGTTSGDPDEFIDALDVDAMSDSVSNTGDAMVQAAGTTTYKAGSNPAHSYNSNTPILAEWNGTTGDLTAGEIVILMRINSPFTDLGD